MDRKDRKDKSRPATMCLPSQSHTRPQALLHDQHERLAPTREPMLQHQPISSKNTSPHQETFISVDTLEESTKDQQQSEAWKRKRRRSVRRPDTLGYMKSSEVRRVQHPLENNLIISILGGLFNVFLMVFISVPITLFVAIMTPISFIAKVISTLCSGQLKYTCKSCRSNRLSAHDAQYLLHGNQSVIHSVLIIDGSLDLKKIRHALSGRVIHAKTGSGELMYPRLTQLVVQFPSGPAWYADHKLNLNDHIYMGPEINSEDQLQKYVAGLLLQPLNVSRPLWEVIVIKGYGRNQDTVLIFRLHQCIADGMSLLKVLCQSLSDNPVMHIPHKPHFGGTTYSANLFRSFLVGPLTILTWLFGWKRDMNLLMYRRPSFYQRNNISYDVLSANGKRRCCGGCNGIPDNSTQTSVRSGSSEGVNSVSTPVPYTVLNLPDKNGFIILWTAAIPLSKVMRVKHVTRTCLNDIILAALAGALRLSLQKLGVIHPPNLKVNIAVDLRCDSQPLTVPSLGTKASTIPINLPLEVEGAIPRIWSVRETLEDMKASADSAVSYCFVWWVYNCLPREWASLLLLRLHSRGSLQYSSLPGPSSTLLLGGYAVKKIYNISPPRDPMNLSVTVLTYGDRIYLTVTTRNAMPNSCWLAKNILKEMEKQCNQMSNTLSHRRLPGEQKRSFLILGTEAHSSRSLLELQSTLARVQTELQLVTEQYELRKGIYMKSRSTDLSKYIATPDGAEERNRKSSRRKGSSSEIQNALPGSHQSKNRRHSGTSLQVALTAQQSHFELATKVQNLKQEFTELLAEIRRRKSISEGGSMNGHTSQIEEEDGEIRKPRKRALSVASVKSMASVTSRDLISSSREFLSSSKDSILKTSSSSISSSATRPSTASGSLYDAGIVTSTSTAEQTQLEKVPEIT